MVFRGNTVTLSQYSVCAGKEVVSNVSCLFVCAFYVLSVLWKHVKLRKGCPRLILVYLAFIVRGGLSNVLHSPPA